MSLTKSCGFIWTRFLVCELHGSYFIRIMTSPRSCKQQGKPGSSWNLKKNKEKFGNFLKNGPVKNIFGPAKNIFEKYLTEVFPLL